MARYILYLRKSQMDRDFDDTSVEETLARHRKILTDFAKKNRLHIAVVLEEVVSGESLSSRPQMLKCLELVNTGEYEGIICMDIDRLSRGSSLDSGYIMQVLQINSCKIVTPSKTYDLANESDEQFTDMKFMFSRYELKAISKRLTRGKNTSASEGKYLGSTPPYGYEIYKLKGIKGNSLRVIPEQAKVVQMIFDMYTEQNMGAYAIAYELNKMHILTTKGNEWTNGGVLETIANPVYVGMIRWKRKPTVKTLVDGKMIQKRVKSKEYELHDGLHEAIITEEQFEKAALIRTSKVHTSTNIHKEIKNPFAGLLRCGKCGSPITRVLPARSNSPCRAKCPKRDCENISIYFNELEDAIVSEMRKWFAGYTITVEQMDDSKAEKDLSIALQMVESQLCELQNQQNKICELLEKGVYSVEIFTKRNATLTADIKKLSADKVDLMKKIENQKKNRTTTKSLLPTTQHLLDSYDVLTAKEKNELWKEVLEKITYYRPKRKEDFELHIYPKIPSR